MKEMAFYAFLIFLLGSVFTLGAQPVQLEDCWERSRAHYPLNDASRALVEELTQERMKNSAAAWYPQLEMGAQASWQSDVPHVDLDNPMFDLPMAPKDQYKAFAEVSQTLYNGGYTRGNKRLTAAEGGAEQQDLEVKLREVKSTVTDVYFSLLKLREQKKQMVAYMDDLDARVRELSSAVKNEMVHVTELNLLEVEKMKAEKQQMALTSSEQALLEILSLFTGTSISEEDELTVPREDLFMSPEARPERKVYAFQQEQLEARQALNQVATRPKLAAFAQAGYGNPGFNMLKDEFDTFYMVGLRLRWQPWDWKVSSRNDKVLALQSELLQQRESSFDLELQRTHYQLSGELQQYQYKMATDSAIVAKHQQIVAHYQTRLKNGAITAADYISALNAASRAQLEMKINHLQYLHSLAKQYMVGWEAGNFQETKKQVNHEE
ncbi:TolC family protein [Geofilum rubicundum]|uniref:Outer membrane efflux protein n=1 Tax=Geofilum rubicundum JCM 15548 TaxID=1236989 RepID=A0A0E9LQ96_9BACT|nr:TolC family protein [Geofilum rubicundum]GAO27787.1 outer membrane efflux protein [Geofilum rubicundum JCM 15548]